MFNVSFLFNDNCYLKEIVISPSWDTPCSVVSLKIINSAWKKGSGMIYLTFKVVSKESDVTLFKIQGLS